MVIVFDALGASNELGAKVTDTAEARSSLYLTIGPMAVLMFLHYISPCSLFARDLCDSTVRVTFLNPFFAGAVVAV